MARPVRDRRLSEKALNNRNVVAEYFEDESDRPTKKARGADDLLDELVLKDARPAPKKRGRAAVVHNTLITDLKPVLEIRRELFLLEKGHLFTPLLPAKNAITVLREEGLTKSLRDDAAGKKAGNKEGNSGAADDESRGPADPSLVKLVPYKRLEQPKGIQGKMKIYQLAGLSFLAYCFENGLSCILGDEMGLGKTLQSISLLAYLHEKHGFKGPHLIVCPLSVLPNWMDEVKRWLPGFKVNQFHGGQNERNRLRDLYSAEPPDIMVTTYDVAVSESSWFSFRHWAVCILDEGHKIKNADTNVSRTLQTVNAQSRIILTGTPIQNNLVELWSLLHFIYPRVFTKNTLERFKASFDITRGTYDQAFLTASRRLLEIVMLRRTKESVQKEFQVPPREELTLYLPLSPVQRFWYKRLITRSDTGTLREIFKISLPVAKRGRRAAGPTGPVDPEEVARAAAAALASGTQSAEADSTDGIDADGHEAALRNIENTLELEDASQSSVWKSMMNLLMQLQKVCDHPYLLPNAESEPYEVAEHIVPASSKFIALDKILRAVIPRGEKVLIFTKFARMLDILEDFMNLRTIRYVRMDGQTSRARRNLNIRLFQKPDKSPYDVLIMTTKTGGLGINLTAASHVVMFDSDWNPSVDIQAISRAHRIGQTRNVRVYRLVCQDSVEEQALRRLQKKMYLSLRVISRIRNATALDEDEGSRSEGEGDGGDDGGEEGMEKNKLGQNELAMMIMRGTGALAQRWGEGTPVAGADESADTADLAAADAFAQFSALSFDELLARGRARDTVTTATLKTELGESVSAEEREALAAEQREFEANLLQGKEAVVTRFFEGKLVKAKQSNADIRREWEDIVDRSVDRKSRVMMIDGHPVLKETMQLDRWQAVRTITSDATKAAALGDRKRARSDFVNQDYCIVCLDGGKVYECRGCPRVYHAECLGIRDRAMKQAARFFCPQHNCRDCQRNVADAGGLLFRCGTCANAYCEECLPQDFEPIGEQLPEFALLGVPKRNHTYYVRCPDCLQAAETNPLFNEFFNIENRRVKRGLIKAGFDIALFPVLKDVEPDEASPESSPAPSGLEEDENESGDKDKATTGEDVSNDAIKVDETGPEATEETFEDPFEDDLFDDDESDYGAAVEDDSDDYTPGAYGTKRTSTKRPRAKSNGKANGKANGKTTRKSNGRSNGKANGKANGKTNGKARTKAEDEGSDEADEPADVSASEQADEPVDDHDTPRRTRRTRKAPATALVDDEAIDSADSPAIDQDVPSKRRPRRSRNTATPTPA